MIGFRSSPEAYGENEVSSHRTGALIVVFRWVQGVEDDTKHRHSEEAMRSSIQGWLRQFPVPALHRQFSSTTLVDLLSVNCEDGPQCAIGGQL